MEYSLLNTSDLADYLISLTKKKNIYIYIYTPETKNAMSQRNFRIQIKQVKLCFRLSQWIVK